MKVVINKDNFKVNGGKEFELPEMNVLKYEEIHKLVLEKKDKYTNIEYTKAMQREMVYYILHEVDATVKEEDVLKLHPEELTNLSNTIWESGKTEDETKFRIGESTSKKGIREIRESQTK